VRSDDQILAELKEATEGLLVVSESDYPLETVRWSGETAITREYLCQVSGKPADSTIKEMDLNTFFQNEIFRNVTDLLKSSLSGTRVYQVGTINIPVYIVGRSPSGNWLGLSTRLIQT
jgi:hypothetical protein